jgi:mannose-6-phosphate isomerase-like protein (cupin superfamily)
MTQSDWMEQLTREGYTNLNVCTMEAATDFGQHTHDLSTVHVILKGSLTMTDKQGSLTISQGERFDIPAGTTHRTNCGPDGLQMIVGVKEN